MNVFVFSPYFQHISVDLTNHYACLGESWIVLVMEALMQLFEQQQNFNPWLKKVVPHVRMCFDSHCFTLSYNSSVH